ncbi:MAG: phenylacetic acid degradation protein PaaN, partial [bacterium]
MSHPLFEKHRVTLDNALKAIQTRGYWAAYNEMPSPKTYGETAPADGKSAFEAQLGQKFDIAQPGQTGWQGGEQSPFGIALNVEYPVCDVQALIDAGQ